MSVDIIYHHCLLFPSCIASVQCDLSAIEFIMKYVFQSCLPVAALPQHTRNLLLTSHCLDLSLPPIAAQKTLLQHIFQAQCFLKTSSSTCHCGIIQIQFKSDTNLFLAHVYDRALSFNPSFPILQLYCEALGTQVYELKSCYESLFLVDYMTNCCPSTALRPV